jgi:hypothetical protein
MPGFADTALRNVQQSSSEPQFRHGESPNPTIQNQLGESKIATELTTLVAAEQTGRTAALVELDPRYADVIVQRFENLTGKKAELAKH